MFELLRLGELNKLDNGWLKGALVLKVLDSNTFQKTKHREFVIQLEEEMKKGIQLTYLLPWLCLAFGIKLQTFKSSRNIYNKAMNCWAGPTFEEVSSPLGVNNQ